jgi:hypothetical protein
MRNFALWIVSIALWLGLPESAGGAPEPTALRWEAEAVPAAMAGSETKHAGDASGGAYAYLPEGEREPAKPLKSKLKIEFEALAGMYTVRVRALAVSSGTDSIFVIVDNVSRQLGFKQYNEWTWLETPTQLARDGRHALTIAAREPSRIDVIELIPSGKGSAAVGFALRQSIPQFPEPNGARPLDVNPPTFRWPGHWRLPYSLQVAREGAGWDAGLEFSGIRETFYRPTEPLEPGRWRWRWRLEGDSWSQAETFEVEATTARWPIPPWEETFSRFPRRRPRILIGPDDLPALRANAAGPFKEAIEDLAQSRRKLIGAELSLAEDKAVEEVGDRRASTIRRVSSKKDAGGLMGRVGDLAFLALLLDRDDFAEEAIRRTMAATRLDPKGYTAHGISDFANATIVKNAAITYDYLHDRLSAQQRRAIRETILARIFQYKPQLEQRTFSAHGWQHVILDLTAGALAIWDEEPEAREWLEWSAKMFVAFYPWYGGADGGSAEGANYYTGTNLWQSLETLQFWRAAAGIDLAGNPWFRANPWFLMASHPPGGPLSSFGDHQPGESPPSSRKAAAALAMAALHDNPDVAAYADVVLDGDAATDPSKLLSAAPSPACYLLWGPYDPGRADRLRELPPARVFRDIGVAYVHSDFADPGRNVMFEMRSSPYGSFNHAHADQNSFNIAAFGEKLIVDSGYYTSYGDTHHYGWTVTTRAHNAILVDGQGQPSRNLDAYGRIVAFDQGDDWAWIVGDASTAYREPALERFHRHAVWLAGDAIQTYVIFDSLAARDGKPHEFSYLLHFAFEPRVNAEGLRATVTGEKGQARISWLTPQSLKFSLTDQFDPPAENWRPDKQGKDFPSQWHLAAVPPDKAPEQRFLAVIQTARADAAPDWPEPQRLGDDGVRIGSDRLTFTDDGVRIERAGAVIFDGSIP